MDPLGVKCVNHMWTDFTSNSLNNGHSPANSYLQTVVTTSGAAASHNASTTDSTGATIVRPCVILIASDRKHEIDLWKNATHLRQSGVNCTVISSNHSVGAHVAWNEHGPFSGE